MIETTTVEAPTNGASAGITSGAICGLTAITIADASPTASAAGLSRRPRAASAVISGAGCGSSTAILLRVEPEREPAFQHGAAHLAGADQQERAGEIGERMRFCSSIVVMAAFASCASVAHGCATD